MVDTWPQQFITLDTTLQEELELYGPANCLNLPLFICQYIEQWYMLKCATYLYVKSMYTCVIACGHTLTLPDRSMVQQELLYVCPYPGAHWFIFVVLPRNQALFYVIVSLECTTVSCNNTWDSSTFQ